MEIFKEFTFDSAHFLPNVPDGHKCKGMHGHTYKLTVYIDGLVDDQFGWVMDFTDVKNIVDPLVKQMDHKLLNDIYGLENPTSENMAKWLYNQIKPNIPMLSKIQIQETLSSGTVYTGK